MPSTRAYLTSWAIWALYYRKKRASEQQILLNVKENWRTESDKEVVPAAIQAAVKVDEEQFQGTGEGGQKWKVFYCAVDKESGAGIDKVVIYWHGGAFISGAAVQHWGAIHRVVRDHHTSVVFPQYTRAPLGTADAWCQNALQFTLGIADDPRYKGKTIVHMGDSAGGWMALRMQQLMRGIVLGEEEGFDGMKERVEGLLRRTGASVLISPAVNFEMSERLQLKNSEDPWLSVELLKAIRRLWIRGSTSIPDIDYELPSDHITFSSPNADPSDKLYAEPRYSLNNGLDVFARYHAKYPSAPPVRLLTMIGTYDICHVGCEDLNERLEKLGGDVVKSEYIEEQGLNHVYPILNLPEADKAWLRVGELLKE